MRFPPTLCLAPLLAAAFLSACTSSTSVDSIHPGWTRFAAPSTRDDASHVAPTRMSALSGGEHNVAIAGTIIDACQTKGCWMRVRDDEGVETFVRFRDYSFFVPRNAAGHRFVARGEAVKRTVSVEMLRHFAEDARKSPAEIAAITEPQSRVEFLADRVWIEGDGLQAPHVEP